MSPNTTEKMTPVTVTRGSEPEILSQRVHWIAGTFKGLKTPELPTILSQKFIECKAFNGYTAGSRFSDGRQHWTNPSRPEMGVHIQWDGEACDNCPIEPLDLITALQRLKFAFTRIDFAIDAMNFGLRPEKATEEIRNGRIKTRSREFPIRNDARHPGYSQYVGKKSSEVYLKLYDKAAEMGVQQDWTRIELTVRHERADKAAAALVFDNDFRRLVVAFVDFPSWDTWHSIMAVAPTKLPAERQTSQTKLWLLRSCASALAKQMHLDGDDHFYFQFLDAVREHYSNIKNTTFNITD